MPPLGSGNTSPWVSRPPPPAGATPPTAPHARLLAPDDDVATVLAAVTTGTSVSARADGVERRVVAVDDIPAGHKIAMHAIAEGVRLRKYGEGIGRLTRDVPAGGWVHDHNLASTALRDPRDDAAWSAHGATTNIEAIGDVRASVGCCASFDARAERLWWADAGPAPALHALHVASGRHRAWAMPEPVRGLALAGSSRLLVALGATLASFDPAAGALATLVPGDGPWAGRRVGPMSVDGRGRLWCAVHAPESSMRDGAVFRLGDDRARWAQAAGDFVAPTGLVIDAAGRTLHVADARRGFVHAFDIADDGTLAARRTLADLGALPGGPGGGTLDSAGCTWWTLWNGGAVVRLRPDGRLDRIVRVPVSRPTSCAFGGPGLSRLFVTSAVDETAPVDEPLAGRVLALDVGVAGCPARSFALEAA